MQWLGKKNIPYLFTKQDKLSKKLEQLKHYKKGVLESWEELPRYFKLSY